MKINKVEPVYISKDGCRLVWKGIDADDSDIISESDFFRIIATRRSTRNFDTSRIVERWKLIKSWLPPTRRQLPVTFKDLKYFI